MSPEQPAKRSRGRDIVFAALTVVGLLAGGNCLVERFEEGGLIETTRPDDAVLFVDEAIFEVDGDSWRTTTYAEQVMVPSRFRRAKGDAWRMFLVGGSFAMGTPYAYQRHGEERPGGMATWIRAELDRRGDGPFEVINLAAGGQNSHRVRRLAEQALRYDPDVLIVATCNNEGALPPSQVREQLHRLGGYRLLTKHLVPSASLSDRSYYTPQDATSVELAEAFEANLRAMVRAADSADVPLLLSALPINRLYRGLAESHGVDQDPAERPRPSDCVAEAISLLAEGSSSAALRQLDGCEDIPDALRWRGLVLIDQGRVEEATVALEQSIELQPRNRCRPGFNTIVREVAAESPNAFLVDLDRLAVEASPPHGLPGQNLFLDYCHMDWRGYAAMAGGIVGALDRAGLSPVEPVSGVLDVEALGVEMALDELPVVRDP